jgi:Zn-dependent alcohol dehydrogenase
MKFKAAVLHQVGRPLEIETVEIGGWNNCSLLSMP